MGIISTNKSNKTEFFKSMSESESAADAAEAGQAGPENGEEKKLHILGAAKILIDWPDTMLRLLILLVLGTTLGALVAIGMRLLLPYITNPDPEKAHLHVVTTNLTGPRACALEALAKKNFDRPVHVILLRHHSPQAIQLVLEMKQKYPNLNAHVHPDPADYFADSPLDSFSSNFSGQDDLLELAARTLALWRHGGASVDLDRPVLNLPAEGEFVQRNVAYGGALLQFPRPCHPALQGLLRILIENNQGSAAEAIARSTKWMCKLKEMEGLGEKSFTPENCFGVHLQHHNIDSPENLECPFSKSTNSSFLEHGMPLMDLFLNLLKHEENKNATRKAKHPKEESNDISQEFNQNHPTQGPETDEVEPITDYS